MGKTMNSVLGRENQNGQYTYEEMLNRIIKETQIKII